MTRLARFVTRQSTAILFLTALVCLAGAYAGWTMPTAVFPQTNFPRVVVLVDSGVMPAEQMLALVTQPIEEAMNDIPGVVSIRTTTSRGSAEVNVFFNWSVDMEKSLLYVQGRLAQLAATLPAGATFQTYRLTFSAFPIIGLSVTSPQRTAAELWELARYTLKPRLIRTAGVARVDLVGGRVREYHILTDPVRLEEIARIGKGAFHATQDFKALPSILSQEALLLSGKPVEERATTPSWVERTAEFFAGLPDKMPPLAGYVLTTRKPQADLHLVVPDQKQEPVPLFASWRYGNGRVVALTTQGAGAWTKEWQAMAEYPLLWSQTLRHVFPGHGEGLFPRLTRRGDDVEVDVEALNQEGVPREGLKVTASLAAAAAAPEATAPLALLEVSPGRYHGRFTLDRLGEFMLRADADQITTEAPLLVAYPALYEFTRADPDRLAALAAVTGGRVLATEAQILVGHEPRWVAHALWQVWVVTALALFMADLIIRYASGLIGLRGARRGVKGAG